MIDIIENTYSPIALIVMLSLGTIAIVGIFTNFFDFFKNKK